MHTGFWSEQVQLRPILQNVGAHARIILKCILIISVDVDGIQWLRTEFSEGLL